MTATQPKGKTPPKPPLVVNCPICGPVTLTSYTNLWTPELPNGFGTCPRCQYQLFFVGDECWKDNRPFLYPW